MSASREARRTLCQLSKRPFALASTLVSRYTGQRDVYLRFYKKVELEKERRVGALVCALSLSPSYQPMHLRGHALKEK
jgi:hypothetical protein